MNASPSFTHKVFVHTADRRGAATSAPVRCTLVGEHGSVDVSIDPATHFARGSVKEFHVSAPGIGAVRAVRLMHDGGAEEDAWLVSQVVVRDAVAQQDAEFPCGFWLDPLSGSTEAELFPHPSGSSKREFEILNRAPPLMQPLGVLLSYAALPHPDKSRLGKDGEDALFVYPERQDQLVRSPYYVMGVADGVAEWALKGVDSGLFSRCLMETARHNAEAGCFSPAQLITAAWGAVSRERIQGSSTACIVSLDGVRGVLRAANLGDSGFMVVREGRVLFRSPEQEHMYGYPFQVRAPLSAASLLRHWPSRRCTRTARAAELQGARHAIRRPAAHHAGASGRRGAACHRRAV